MNDKTVYVVEDDSEVRMVFLRQLNALGYDCELFESGEQFLAELDGNKIPENSCLLFDYLLPGMDGIELQEELLDRELPLPVVLISGKANSEVVARAMRLGAIDVLLKPIQMSILESAVNEALNHSAGMVSLAESYKYYTRRESRSPKQREILGLAAEGKPNKRIASLMNCSVKTVE